jgi:sporulation protein YunB
VGEVEAMAKWKRTKRYPRGGGKLVLLLLLFLALFVFVERQLSPIIEEQAAKEAHKQAFAAITQAISRQILVYAESGDYQQLMHIERDSGGRITLLSPDTMLLNSLVNGVAMEVEQSLDEVTGSKFSLPLGAATGSRLLATLGPELHFGFRSVAAPKVTVVDEFTSAGINQVRHRIYVQVEADLRVIAPFAREDETVTATVLLAEGIIVGYTPDTYVNITP